MRIDTSIDGDVLCILLLLLGHFLGAYYCSSEEGEVYAIAAGPEFRKLAVNKLEDSVMATPAISERWKHW